MVELMSSTTASGWPSASLNRCSGSSVLPRFYRSPKSGIPRLNRSTVSRVPGPNRSPRFYLARFTSQFPGALSEDFTGDDDVDAFALLPAKISFQTFSSGKLV
ncbi:hypothetical protein FEM48_Zijuj11G0102200 [Ziziphus jujuba var. spinosa]|uniref:Uncharacterized protein n=1 Tax=Ziziphus jujuba var. spinosa TaxID=714518 RepID=A0A978UIC8_ZIZJJ|nr:hypothetical protein FEM48_Zijuj11G0102200 [Ziziphus jujuba var. spinosa]